MGKDAHAEALYKGLKKCFQDNTFFDVIVASNGKEFKAHKLILGMHSEFMDAIFKRWDQAGEDKENSKVDMTNEDYPIVEAMLCYMCSSDYSAASSTPDSLMSPMIFNVRVYALATEYAIKGLQELSAKKFDETATKCWEMDDFVQAIHEVYSTTHPSEQGLRKTVVRIVCEHTKALLKRQDFGAEMESKGEFGAAVVKALQSNTKNDEKSASYSCVGCRKTFKIEPALQPGITYWCMFCAQGRTDWEPTAK